MLKRRSPAALVSAALFHAVYGLATETSAAHRVSADNPRRSSSRRWSDGVVGRRPPRA